MITETVEFWQLLKNDFTKYASLEDSFSVFCNASNQFKEIWHDRAHQKHLIFLAEKFFSDIKPENTQVLHTGFFLFGGVERENTKDSGGLLTFLQELKVQQVAVRVKFCEWNIKRLEENGTN